MSDQEVRLTQLIDEIAIRYRGLIEEQAAGGSVEALRAARVEGNTAMLDLRRALAELAALRDCRDPDSAAILVRAA